MVTVRQTRPAATVPVPFCVEMWCRKKGTGTVAAQVSRKSERHAMPKNKPLVSVVVVAVGSLIGVLFASMLVSAPGMMGRYSTIDAGRDWLIPSAGAVIGGILFSWASKR